MSGSWDKNHPASPHKLFNAYVQQLADVTPFDGDEMILGGEEDVGLPEIEMFQWDRVTKRESHCSVRHHPLIFPSDPRLLEELAYTMYKFIMRGGPSTWWTQQKPLVEYGLARFVWQKPTEPKISIEEPLALISIMRYFESNSRTFETHIRRLLQDAQGIALEEALDVDFESPCLVVQKALGEDTHPLAKLSRALTAELAARRDGKSIVSLLGGTLKRAQPDEDADNEAKDDRPNATRRGVVKRHV